MSGNDRNQPLFDPYLYRAMREVARGEIRSSGVGGPLSYRNREVPARLADSVVQLEGQGYVAWAPSGVGDGWLIADLTMAGSRLFVSWMTSAGHSTAAWRLLAHRRVERVEPVEEGREREFEGLGVDLLGVGAQAVGLVQMRVPVDVDLHVVVEALAERRHGGARDQVLGGRPAANLRSRSLRRPPAP